MSRDLHNESRTNKNILAIIPARSGSKSVPHKNIRIIAEKPMLAYSIEHAQQSRYINRIILNTDSEQYAQVGKTYGAEIPFLRPEKYAGDYSTDYEVFYHCLNKLYQETGYLPDIVVHLRPTYPIRDVRDIDNMIEILMEQESADSIRSIAPAKEIAYKMWLKAENNRILPLMSDIPEAYNKPRQELPQVYYQNACIDVIKTKTILEKHSMTGQIILGYEMDKNYDIDTEEELLRAEELLKLFNGKRKFVFDIDGVIAQLEPDNNYNFSKPNRRMVDIINLLYSIGHYIVLFTARGYTTGLDWRAVTEEQLKKWEVHYHELHFGKPNADYYIDDKLISLNVLNDFWDLYHMKEM